MYYFYNFFRIFLNSEARKIEKTGIREEDIPQRDELVSEGFLPTIYPSLMDNLDVQYPLIAGLPLTNTYYCNEDFGMIGYSKKLIFRTISKVV